MSPVPPGVDIARVSGPLLVGELLHWGLFGTLSVQIYLYYMAFPRDKLIIKIIAYFVYTMELTQTILVTNDAFHAYGSGFGNWDEMTSMHMNWFSIPVMSGVVSLIGQLFFSYRIWVLSKSRIIPGIVAVLAFTTTVAGFLTGIYVKDAGKITNLHQVHTKIAVGIWCGVSALCDIFIAICMTYYLSKSAESCFARTKLMLSRLIRVTIETGSVTAIIATCTLIFVTGFPNETYYTTFSLIMPKAYANTLLVILNSRFRIVGGRDDEEESDYCTTTLVSSIDQRLSSTQRSSTMFGGSIGRNRRSLRNSGLGMGVIAIGLQKMDSAASLRHGERKDTIYGNSTPVSPVSSVSPVSPLGQATPPRLSTRTGGADSSDPQPRPGAKIQISVHNEVITDADDVPSSDDYDQTRGMVKSQSNDTQRVNNDVK
ncbi:hypothetical protein K435DRAFT_715355 [Dendrothele bispora CBS 962.96]|uniref:DUF6534 domain-containing protein n=1 Tax=Dendrothele bispora (strain CBS 962.96) TaxID=1314807 RepID=A0A4S8MLI3_DENBC|nr:hypothetical protein K435DRAFT_715355 [Dendrothele bispora CBS 962.96]